MKKGINAVLFLCAAAMLFICWRSIAGQQEFDAEVEARQNAVKARLIEIRDAQEAYKVVYGMYCSEWDTLVAFVKEGKLPVVVKQGTLTDKQLEAGLTESKATAIVNRGNAAEIAAAGLQDFRRDTVWVNLMDSLYKDENFDPEELPYVPFSEEFKGNEDRPEGGKQKFDLLALPVKTKSEAIIQTMECGATYDVFLSGSSNKWQRKVNELNERAEGMGAFNGLKIGDASMTWNNNAGNWE